MRGGKLVWVTAMAFLLMSSFRGYAQETVFSLLKSQTELADQYYAEKNYRKALSLYRNQYRKDHSAGALRVKMARCHYFLKEYKQAANVFESYTRSGAKLSASDRFCFAESLASTGNYKKAVDAYYDYLKLVPDDELVVQKIWRLDNIQFLYEDSLHYAVRSMTLNTTAGELNPVPYKNGFILMSNRKEVQVVQEVDASNSPFYKAYFVPSTYDSINGILKYGAPILFSRDLFSRFHTARVVFYNEGKKMVFASTGEKADAQGARTFRIYFAEEQQGEWKVKESFPYNSDDYSMSDPTINNEGTVLYFTSDKPGGMGGKDIYRAEYKNERWSNPENLGDAINTAHDETFPFLHPDKSLYFSSNGHPGMGGLDIFKTQYHEGAWKEVTNIGSPVNSSLDDFGIYIDSLSTHGYFSSNRKNAGFDDDLYEFDMDLQTYPLVIHGIVQMKEHNWSDSSALQPVSRAKLLLIDNIKDVVVLETHSDENGNFTMSIPYFSKYKIRIIASGEDEHIVSLEIPKYRKIDSKHEIVIVKDVFQSK
jgi:tetratricopeptide (TPR) repeat protein